MTERKKLVFPSLIVSISSIDPPSLIISISLIEIAATFGVSVAIAGQIRSVSSALSILVALAMGVLSVKYSYKTLLLAGLVINLVSAIACGFAPSFTLLIICFSTIGLVTSLVSPMIFSYIGEIYPSETRSQIIGTLASLRTVSYLIMVQLINYVVTSLGWRQAFLFLVAPITLIGILLSRSILPEMRSKQTGDPNVLEGYKNVLSSKSALSCLFGNMLAGGAWAGGVVTYSVTYLREGVKMTISEASNLFSLLVIGVLLGNYLGGLLARRVGLKNLIAASSLLTGLLIVAYMKAPGGILLMVICGLMSLFAGIVLTCANSLLLTQVPSYRGTVTSLNSAATQLGMVFGVALGGLVLSIYGWGLVGVTYGLMHVVAALSYFFGTSES